MPIKKYRPEQIVTLLRQIEVEIAYFMIPSILSTRIGSFYLV